RVATGVWMGLVGLGLLCIVLKIITRRDNSWLLRRNLVTAVAVLYCCAFVNFDGLIAWFNVRHCREVSGTGVSLDVGYLRELGEEALPALAWVESRLPEPQAAGVRVLALRQRGEVSRKLEDWRGWTWRRSLLGQQANLESPLGIEGTSVLPERAPDGR
ncbi:MAG: DUF4153 domain-containing protein, partial [Phycisphaerae bacterium]